MSGIAGWARLAVVALTLFQVAGLGVVGADDDDDDFEGGGWVVAGERDDDDGDEQRSGGRGGGGDDSDDQGRSGRGDDDGDEDEGPSTTLPTLSAGGDDDDASGPGGGDDDSRGPGGGDNEDDDGDDDDDENRRGRRGGDDEGEDEFVDDDADPFTDGYRARQVIVQMAPGGDVGALLGRSRGSVIAGDGARGLFLVDVSLLPGTEQGFAAALAQEPAVAWVDLNYGYQAPEGRPRRFFVSGEPLSIPVAVAEADAYAPNLIGVATASACATGEDVIVAVIDTGVDDDHPVLRDRLEPGWDVFANRDDADDAGDGFDNDADGLIDEMTGHGTHVAGIVRQAAPEARILPIKALNSDGVGDAFYLALAIYHAIDQSAEVINLSLGSTADARVVREAVAAAVGAGITVVAAAGNDDRNTPPEYPAAYPGVVAVASTDAADRKSPFSSYGPDVALSAPGSAIVSTYPDGRLRVWSGTSMATPWVAGAAALLGSSGLTPSQSIERLAATAADLDDLNPGLAGELGAGRIDVAAAMRCEATSASRG